MKKVITCLGCRAEQSRCLFLKIVIICTQPTAHQEHLHTYTLNISHFFSSFLRAFFSNFVCLSLFFLLLFYLILLACPGGACTYTLYTLYEPYAQCVYARTHTNAPQTQCTCMLHYIRRYYFQQIHNIIVVDDRALAAVIAAATVCRCRMSMQPTTHSYGVLQSVNPNGFQDIENPDEFIRSFVGLYNFFT